MPQQPQQFRIDRSFVKKLFIVSIIFALVFGTMISLYPGYFPHEYQFWNFAWTSHCFSDICTGPISSFASLGFVTVAILFIISGILYDKSMYANVGYLAAIFGGIVAAIFIVMLIPMSWFGTGGSFWYQDVALIFIGIFTGYGIGSIVGDAIW